MIEVGGGQELFVDSSCREEVEGGQSRWEMEVETSMRRGGTGVETTVMTSYGGPMH